MVAAKATLPVSAFYYSQIDFGVWMAKTALYGMGGGIEVQAPGATLGEAERNLLAFLWLLTAARGSA